MKNKKQHFLLSASARTLSLRKIFQLTPDESFELFKQTRWPQGKPVCPHCGGEHHYYLKTRKQWRCKDKDCGHTFSVTSGTIFSSHKLPLSVYLAAIAIYTNAVKGISALQLSRDLDVQYKTAFVLAHKIRESLLNNRDESVLSGDIEMDGAYVNGHVRPENKKEERVDRRLAENQRPDKRCVLVFRQRQSDDNTGRTLPFIINKENQADVVDLAGRFIDKQSTIFADENSAYDPLHGKFDTKRINHQKAYSYEDGTTTNYAESYFSRFRRMQYGQVHKFGNLYLLNYANEAAYREDNRRMNNGDMFDDILKKCTKTRTSRDFGGYWQGNRKLAERLAG
jgi:transposase-like protein